MVYFSNIIIAFAIDVDAVVRISKLCAAPRRAGIESQHDPDRFLIRDRQYLVPY